MTRSKALTAETFPFEGVSRLSHRHDRNVA